jgi:hypothetical protein
MLFFLYPRFESGRINPVLFQATLTAMGVATFSLVFATLHYYRCSLGGRMSDTERTLQAQEQIASGFWVTPRCSWRQVWSCSCLGFVSSHLSGSLLAFVPVLRGPLFPEASDAAGRPNSMRRRE